MQNSELVLYVIKLILGGIAAFFAIMLWSKTRDIAWMCLVAGTITSYAGVVYTMMTDLGIFLGLSTSLFGMPIPSLVFAVIPNLFYISAFVLMLIRSRY